jgi:thioredoxin
MIRDINEALFNDMMKRTDKVVVVEFWSPGCSVCKDVAPAYEQVAQEMEEEATFVRINTDGNVQMAQRLGVSGTPTFMFFCRQGKLGEVVGFTSATLLRNTIRDSMRYNPICPGKKRLHYEMDGYG